MSSDKPNHWKGFVLGLVGGMAGLVAMRHYWQYVAPAVPAQDSDEDYQQLPAEVESNPLSQVPMFGKQYRPDESSTAALGRILYRKVTGWEPETEETRTMLSYLVHWSHGMLMGGVYGAIAGPAKGWDTSGGLAYGTALWLYGDEAMVPLLGLQAGPASFSIDQHAHRWGAHLAYGVTTAAVTQFLQRIF